MFGFLLLGYAAGAAAFWTLLARNAPVIEEYQEMATEAEIIEFLPYLQDERKAA